MSPGTLPASANGSKLRQMVGAVTYIRVSTKEQTENLSRATQLKACEEYCERQGFEVLARFREEGESAKTVDRTELQKLLQFCRTHKGRGSLSSCSTSRASRAKSTTTLHCEHISSPSGSRCGLRPSQSTTRLPGS